MILPVLLCNFSSISAGYSSNFAGFPCHAEMWSVVAPKWLLRECLVRVLTFEGPHNTGRHHAPERYTTLWMWLQNISHCFISELAHNLLRQNINCCRIFPAQAPPPFPGSGDAAHWPCPSGEVPMHNSVSTGPPVGYLHFNGRGMQ